MGDLGHEVLVEEVLAASALVVLGEEDLVDLGDEDLEEKDLVDLGEEDLEEEELGELGEEGLVVSGEEELVVSVDVADVGRIKLFIFIKSTRHNTINTYNKK